MSRCHLGQTGTIWLQLDFKTLAKWFLSKTCTISKTFQIFELIIGIFFLSIVSSLQAGALNFVLFYTFELLHISCSDFVLSKTESTFSNCRCNEGQWRTVALLLLQFFCCNFCSFLYAFSLLRVTRKMVLLQIFKRYNFHKPFTL